ncbi:MAG: hypothetical protein CMN77_09020 [Spirochaetaceae bacterium]|nr:hypothetical protein [Spirochaetaceae bacterium]
MNKTRIKKYIQSENCAPLPAVQVATLSICVFPSMKNPAAVDYIIRLTLRTDWDTRIVTRLFAGYANIQPGEIVFINVSFRRTETAGYYEEKSRD